MRRKDREMSKDYALAVIDRAAYGVLSVAGDDKIISVPLSIVREGDKLYFHSAKAGEKVATLKNGSEVIIVFVDHVQVPQNLTNADLEKHFENNGSPSILAKQIFTTEFSSAIIRGRAHLVEGDEMLHGLKLICQKYTPSFLQWFEKAAKASMDVVSVYRIDIEDITGKSKQVTALTLNP